MRNFLSRCKPNRNIDEIALYTGDDPWVTYEKLTYSLKILNSRYVFNEFVPFFKRIRRRYTIWLIYDLKCTVDNVLSPLLFGCYFSDVWVRKSRCHQDQMSCESTPEALVFRPRLFSDYLCSKEGRVDRLVKRFIDDFKVRLCCCCFICLGKVRIKERYPYIDHEKRIQRNTNITQVRFFYTESERLRYRLFYTQKYPPFQFYT